MKFLYFRFRRQREPVAGNHSFFAFTRKAIRVKQAKVRFAYFVLRDQYGIMEIRKVLACRDVVVATAVCRRENVSFLCFVGLYIRTILILTFDLMMTLIDT